MTENHEVLLLLGFCAVLWVCHEVMERRRRSARETANSLPRPMIIDVGEVGPLLKWKEVQALLRGNRSTLSFRTHMQVLEFHRQLYQRAVQDKSNVPNGQTAFEAGAAAGIADVMAVLWCIERGEDYFPDVRAYFGEAPPEKPSPKP